LYVDNGFNIVGYWSKYSAFTSISNSSYFDT
jgi:hypothetical protein